MVQGKRLGSRVLPAVVGMLVSIGMLSACQRNYSPNNYSSGAVQQASKVDRAVVESVRIVDVSLVGLGSGIGAGAGAAGGAVVGAQAGQGSGNALAVLGGVLVGGAIGLAAEKAATDTQVYEYIVKKQNGDLMAVAQSDEHSLAIGQKVFIIYGLQARIIPDVGEASPPVSAPGSGG